MRDDIPKSFVFYYNWGIPSFWDEDLNGLKESGIRYVMLLNSFDYRSIRKDPEKREMFYSFLRTLEKHEMYCVVILGRPKGIFIDPDVKQEYFAYMAEAVRETKAFPALYAVYVADEPTGDCEYPDQIWKQYLSPDIERIQASSMTEDGKVAAIRRLKSRAFSEYISELVALIKRENANIKTTICFNNQAIVPVVNFVRMEEVAKPLDFILVDVYPGWENDQWSRDHTMGMLVKAGKSLTEKEVWAVVGSHTIFTRYHPTLREIKGWTKEALDNGADVLGWFAMDFVGWPKEMAEGEKTLDKYAVYRDQEIPPTTGSEGASARRNNEGRSLQTQWYRGIPTSFNSAERWELMMELSEKFAASAKAEPDYGESGVLFSYDTAEGIYHDYHHFIMPFGLFYENGIKFKYVSDASILDKGSHALHSMKYLYTTPCEVAQEGMRDTLIEFVDQGGCLVSSAEDFAVDEQLRNTDLRRELLGIREERVFATDDRIVLTADLEHLKSGEALPSYYCRIEITDFEPDVEVIGRWENRGTPAIIRRRIGKGQVIYIGTNPYWASVYPVQDPNWGRFMRSLDGLVSQG